MIQQIQLGEMGEWLKSAVLKTVVPKGTGGSNPSLSAKAQPNAPQMRGIFYLLMSQACLSEIKQMKNERHEVPALCWF